MKMRTVLLILIGVAVLMTASGSAALGARASTTVSSALSGGRYVLTIQSTGVSPAGGYRLRDATTVVDPAAGCCCKANLPCVIK
jgi:hypothetical protein